MHRLPNNADLLKISKVPVSDWDFPHGFLGGGRDPGPGGRVGRPGSGGLKLG